MGTLAWVGLLLFVLGGLALLVAAFRESFWWGLFALFFPPVQLLFVLLHWGKAWRPLLLQLLGMVLMLVALVRSTGFDYTQYQQAMTQYQQFVQAMQAASTAPEEPVPEYSDDDPTIIRTPLPAQPAGTVYQCTDAQGRVTFSQQACEGEVIKDFPPENAPHTGPFSCDGRTHCSQMTSCEEAQYFLAHCPGVKMDGDDNGVPCERQWCGE